MDDITECDGKSLIVKYYIVKKSLLPTKIFLKSYCLDQYNKNKSYLGGASESSGTEAKNGPGPLYLR